ncbi:MAG: endonuclease/exonuclease/phosphatase family protein [Ilumatobacter sp.]|uniref:endonuclease/exonuclease/phosphatase family protein n=1 Tax=Ilumatobacter sp. TaxID=1967498 RepID=UPI003299BD5B
MGASLRIVSWNIEFGLRPDEAARDLTEHEDLIGADLVLLQEMDRPGSELVAAALGFDHAYAAAAVFPGTGRELGNAILSRSPLSGVREISLPHTARFGGQARSALTATIDVGGVAVAAYSVHAETVLLRYARRLDQYATVVADLERFAPATPVIVGGDFNTVGRREVRGLVRTMSDAGLVHVSSPATATFSRFGRDFTLDHVFTRHAVCRSSAVVTDSTASDHRPIRIDLDFEPG